jgi:hypothetical protein
MASIMCCMSTNQKDNKVKKAAAPIPTHQVAPAEARHEVVQIQIDEASADNAVS